MQIKNDSPELTTTLAIELEFRIISSFFSLLHASHWNSIYKQTDDGTPTCGLLKAGGVDHAVFLWIFDAGPNISFRLTPAPIVSFSFYSWTANFRLHPAAAMLPLLIHLPFLSAWNALYINILFLLTACYQCCLTDTDSVSPAPFLCRMWTKHLPLQWVLLPGLVSNGHLFVVAPGGGSRTENAASQSICGRSDRQGDSRLLRLSGRHCAGE